MAKKTGKRATKRHDAAAKRSHVKKSAAHAAAATPQSAIAAPPPAAGASQRFVNDLLIRGEAAEPDKQGRLPSQATHAIKKRNPDGSVDVQRVRFKVF
jgi:hypothetical protein